ncbi:hypothetical protein PVAND_016935 [Polypedilum vanderplanki]|uniref:Leucine-rich immune protein (Short) n=1 Tax=Polypedilum vanderplanki TaxID=319348 RepID=A0A9J6BGM1_POLVA|nr:hypothetical protein PVAND_016935 [Polypedilum vanderplanki]
MNLLFLLTIFTSITLKITAETLKCNFTYGQWLYLPEPEYFAFVTNPEIFNGAQVIIDNVEGNHSSIFHSNINVRGIDIHNATNMVKFPRNIDKFFKNLSLIGIFESKLAEITQIDLMVFPQLRHLYLSHNKIRVIKNDLFKFNQRLEVILLYKNEILHIDSRSFSELNKLRMLYLGLNICKFGNARTRNEVLGLLEKIENGSCTREEFLSAITENPLREELRKLQEENKKLKDDAAEKEQEISILMNTAQKLSVRVSNLVNEKEEWQNKVNEMTKKYSKAANFTEIIKQKDNEINALKVQLHQQVKENHKLITEKNLLLAGKKNN